MGYIKHNAIIVTSFDVVHLHTIYDLAYDIFYAGEGWNIISPIMQSPINSYQSFFIAPDGSKEGWGDSHKGDELRQQFKDEAKALNLFVDIVEVAYGGDDPQQACIIDTVEYEEPEFLEGDEEPTVAIDWDLNLPPEDFEIDTIPMNKIVIFNNVNEIILHYEDPFAAGAKIEIPQPMKLDKPDKEDLF